MYNEMSNPIFRDKYMYAKTNMIFLSAEYVKRILKLYTVDRDREFVIDCYRLFSSTHPPRLWCCYYYLTEIARGCGCI